MLRSWGSNLVLGSSTCQRMISTNSYARDEQGDNPGLEKEGSTRALTRASVKLFELGVRTPGAYFWAYSTLGVSIFGVFGTELKQISKYARVYIE